MFNQYSLSIMGIICEIIGSFFLTLEAFGFKWIEKPLKNFVHFANKSRKSLGVILVLGFVLIIPFILASIFKSSILGSLLFPASIFILVFTTLVDESHNLEKWTIVSINNKKIGPIGFIMLLVGNLMQLISVIVQIK